MTLGGSIQDAISEMEQGLATKRATGAEIKVPYYFGLLAEACRRTNRITEGLNHIFGDASPRRFDFSQPRRGIRPSAAASSVQQGAA
jgi:hypothetical protein